MRPRSRAPSAGRRRPGAAGADQDRGRARRSRSGRSAPISQTRCRRAHQRPARGRSQPARRQGRAADGATEPRLHRSPGAGRRPRRHASKSRSATCRRRSRRAGADDAGVGQSDLRELQRRRAGGGTRVEGRSRTNATPPQARAHPGADGDRRQRRHALAKAACSSSTTRSTPGAARCACAPCSTTPDGRLMPGQFVRMRMGQPQAEPALLVNERAVGTDQNKKFVMVVDADNKAAYREVTLGASVERPARRDERPGGRRAHRRQRPAARAPGRAGRAASWWRWRPRPALAHTLQVRSGACRAHRQYREATEVDQRGRSRPAAPGACASQPWYQRDSVMNFSRFFIDRPIFAGVLSILIFARRPDRAAGAADREYPEVVPPSVVVRAPYPGRQPEGDRRDRRHAARGSDQRRRGHALHEQPGRPPTA